MRPLILRDARKVRAFQDEEHRESILMTVSDRLRVQNLRILSANHYTLKTITFERRRGCE
jgi:hypothetical protein